MLVTKNDVENNVIEMINVSSIKGKENKLIYNSNIIIKNYTPLPVPTFAKLDTVYLLDNFVGLEKYIAFNGMQLEKNELKNFGIDMLKESSYNKDIPSRARKISLYGWPKANEEYIVVFCILI